MCILKKIKMDSFEINKIIAAVLVTVLIVFGIGKISDIIFHVEAPKVQGYKVEVKLASSSNAGSESQIDIAALLSMGDIGHGEKVFKKCAACHSIKKDGGNKIGPKLWGVMFRPIASITDYKYSKALSEYKKEWSWEEMNGFLIKPSKWIKGNKMGFAGLKKEKDRASVILYLNQNSDEPKELP
jgi:cytochrome c|tara:strand:- start:702 stop:1253 length:552 start_codon:yes stop_codon:yes gene_type:complete